MVIYLPCGMNSLPAVFPMLGLFIPLAAIGDKWSESPWFHLGWILKILHSVGVAHRWEAGMVNHSGHRMVFLLEGWTLPAVCTWDGRFSLCLWGQHQRGAGSPPASSLLMGWLHYQRSWSSLPVLRPSLVVPGRWDPTCFFSISAAGAHFANFI